MKKIIFVLMAAIAPLATWAQDQLVTEDGVLKVWDVEIASTKVYYKLDKNAEDSKSIAKDKVLMWKKADGTKVRIDQAPAPVAAPQASATPAATGTVVKNLTWADLSEKMKNINIKRREEFNVPLRSIDNNAKSQTRDVLDFFADDETVFENADIRVTPKVVDCYMDKDVIKETYEQYSDQVNMYYAVKGWTITVYNKTSHNIYVDQQNCFIIVNQKSFPIYNNTVTVSGSTTGSSSLLLFGGTSSTANTTTQSTVQQRVVTIPPQSSKTLDVVNMQKGENSIMKEIIESFKKYQINEEHLKIGVFGLGGIYNISYPTGVTHDVQNANAVVISNLVSYSNDDKLTKETVLKQNYRLDQYMGVEGKDDGRKIGKHFNSDEVNLTFDLSGYAGCGLPFMKSAYKKQKGK